MQYYFPPTYLQLQLSTPGDQLAGTRDAANNRQEDCSTGHPLCSYESI
jgi:hypothetical protein